MDLGEAISIALESLRVNRLRSMLTLLGIVIGVMTVIVVISFISGLNTFVTDEVFDLGGDVFIINRTPDIVIDPDDWNTIRQRKNLLLDDANAVREGCTACQAVGARLTSTAQVKYGREFLSTTQVKGITPEVPEILVENLEAGRYVTDYVVRHSGRVSVVGADVVDNLFPFVDPVGKTLRINNRQFEIVGVGERQGSLMGQSPDNWVVIPITSFQRMWGARRSVRIYAKTDSE